MLVIAIAAVCSLGLWALGESGDEAVLAVVPDGDPEPTQVDSKAIQASRPEPSRRTAPEQRAVTRESVLQAHWGPRWDEVRSKALEAGIKLEQAVAAPPAWDEVEKEIETKFILGPSDRDRFVLARLGSIPDPLTAEWVSESYDVEGLTIDGTLLADVQDTLLAHSESLERLVDETYRELEFAVRDIWTRKQYSAAPYFLPADESLVPTCYSSSVALKSWCVGYVVSLDDYPVLRVQGKEIQQAIRDRNLAIQAQLDRRK